MKSKVVLVLMMLVLAVSLALPGMALAAKRPKINVGVTISATATTASTTTVYSGEQVLLHVEAYNASSVPLSSFTVEIPQLWWGIYSNPTSGDKNGNYVLDPDEKWTFDITIDGRYEGPCPTKTTRYTVDFCGWDKSIDPAVYYYVSNAAQVRFVVGR